MSGDGAGSGSGPALTESQTDFAQRVAREQLRLIQGQVGRLPLASVLIDVFICWVVARVGLLWPALLWLSVLLAVQVWRWFGVRRALTRPAADPRAALRVLSTALVGLGVLRGGLALVLFSRPVQVEHYFFTMVYVGMMAGAVGSVAGLARPFFAWGALACGTLAVAWIAQGTADAIWQGVLILVLLVMLTGHVRDQRKGLEQLVKLAYDNERLAESLRAARDHAESASLSKTRFFAAASHDLRQPLHALSINAFALAMLARRQGQPKIVALSDSIERALRQSTGLLDGLLDVSRLDAGAVQADWHDLDLGPMLDSIGLEFRPLAAQGGLALDVQRPDTPLLVRTDPDLLRRVLTNLLGNALKFTRQGGVTLLAARDGDRVLLAVTDTGIGIPAADQARVFEEFYQADNPARDRSQGLGLGLAIVRRISVLLDIEVALDSAAGRGTRITLRLPAGDAAGMAQNFAAGPAAAEVDDVLAPLGLQVLVIDDEPDICESMQALLEQLGCEARCVDDLAAALALVRGGWRPQLILADHRLRQGDGLAALAALHAELGPVPAMLVTGDTAPDTLAQLAASGHRVLHKPVDGALLAQALRETVAVR